MFKKLENLVSNRSLVPKFVKLTWNQIYREKPGKSESFYMKNKPWLTNAGDADAKPDGKSKELKLENDEYRILLMKNFI